MAASLQHAQPVLTAAINAGFRESGIQSLKNLDDPKSFPMVAIRSSGIGLSSLIGYKIDSDEDVSIRCMVDESYLQLLLSIANERFLENSKRVHRFQGQLLSIGRKQQRNWEDGKARAERMKAQGLEQQNQIALDSVGEQQFNYDCEDGLFLGLHLGST